ncbi:aminoglycoside phosphotransferase family protein [Dactylosporangium sp. NPDC051485]|uniref:aminoglycoside phosphotransferase family protein n=1 Tax=Dactylosporangium sp. NPDC051485 TaxID=3154846 RepID=UPI0034224EAD
MTLDGLNAQQREPLTPATLAAVVQAVGEQLDVDVRDAVMVKFTNNAVFRLAHAPVVVRIAGSEAMRQRAPKVVQMAAWLAELGHPAVRLVSGIDQPITAHGHLVTAWQTVPETGARPTGHDLAAIIRMFEALPPPPFPLPTWNPFVEIWQRIRDADGVTSAELAFLEHLTAEVQQRLRDVRFALPPGVIHGDIFAGNVLMSPDGPVICDFDSTSIGPREWDLTPVAVGKLRFDYPGDTHSVLAADYGFDVTTWDGFPVLQQIRELKLITSVLPILNTNPRIRAQWRHRFDSIRNGDTSAKWTTYS